jgi:type IV pilus assembly protein PilA
MKTRQQFLLILIFTVLFLGNAGHFMLSQVFTNYQARSSDSSRNSDTKANLHNAYLGCKAFWANEGTSKTCTVSMIANEEYGYVQSQEVKIHGSGTENDLCAVAWNQGNSEIFKMDSTGQIKEYLDKIRIYQNLLPRQFVYHSIILILPITTMILTLWAGGDFILRKKRKYSYLWVVIAFCWAFIAVITFGLAGSDYAYSTMGPGIFSMLLVVPPLFSALRASSLIRWGKQIERAKDLPDYLENHSAKKLKNSGICLIGVMGILLAVNITVLITRTSQLSFQRKSKVLSKAIHLSFNSCAYISGS